MKNSDTLDVADSRVIAALQLNPRAGSGEIGRAIGEHERTVARRIQRLIAWRVIHPTALYDAARSGLGSVVQLRLEVERGCVQQAARALAQRKDIRRVVAVSGRSDVLWCEVVVDGRGGLHTLMTEGIPDVPTVEKFHVSTTLRTFTTVAQWRAPVLTTAEERALRARAVPFTSPLADRYELTTTDHRVAAALIRNARISLTDMAGELGFSVATAGRRVNSLLERGILALRTEVEPALLGLPVQAQICLKVSPAKLDAVGSALAACPEVRYCAAITGTHNLILEVAVAHEAGLYRFFGEQLGSIEHIADFACELITHAYKRGSVIKDAEPEAERSRSSL
ncbi:Lrp/AsnC family transcriptional regulator [Streptomyces sp. NPDC048436]|uniref:Lrp/AsnC family transcriptional regulator n=1 Tax=Streptomyces sp. NPDC048436 TaxID=3365550 RepID=UPI0037104C77